MCSGFVSGVLIFIRPDISDDTHILLDALAFAFGSEIEFDMSSRHTYINAHSASDDVVGQWRTMS